MSRILHIFDLLPFIHAGSVNKYARLEKIVDTGVTWLTQKTPAGGTCWLLKNIYQRSFEGDVIVCCDRNPTIKKDMIPGYKSSRSNKEAISVDAKLAEYVLQECGITTFARVGYEADDIIYTLVKRLHDRYDNIYIHTGDSDLYFLVDDVVSIKPSSSRAKEVTMSNYEQVALKGGIKYNCITMYKILCGDTSDEIPGLPKKERDQLAEAIYKEEFLPHLGDKSFVEYWVGTLCPWALPRVHMVFPLDVEDIPDEINPVNRQMILNFGDSMNNQFFRGKGESGFNIEHHIDILHSKGIYLEEENNYA